MKPIIQVEHLRKKFGKLVAVNDVNLAIKEGQIYGILGPNGAGKSTTIRMLCGVITPTSGKASVNGLDVYKEAEKIEKNIRKFMEQSKPTAPSSSPVPSQMYG